MPAYAEATADKPTLAGILSCKRCIRGNLSSAFDPAFGKDKYFLKCIQCGKEYDLSGQPFKPLEPRFGKDGQIFKGRVR